MFDQMVKLCVPLFLSKGAVHVLGPITHCKIMVVQEVGRTVEEEANRATRYTPIEGGARLRISVETRRSVHTREYWCDDYASSRNNSGPSQP